MSTAFFGIIMSLSEYTSTELYIMEGTSVMNKSISTSKKTSPLISSVLRAVIAGAAAFTICILIIPLILTKCEAPEDLISVSAAAAAAVTAFASAFAASINSKRNFILTGTVNSLIIILILVCTSLVFGKSEDGKDYLFSGILYAVSLIFSLLGAKAAPTGNKKKNRRR